MESTTALKENEMTTETHTHELCTETHAPDGLFGKPHCVECGEDIPVPANWTAEDIATWTTPLIELAR